MNIKIAREKKYNSGKVLGFVDIVIDGIIKINGCSIVDGNKGIFVSMPQTKKGDNYYPVCQVAKDKRNEFNGMVLSQLKFLADEEGEESVF